MMRRELFVLVSALLALVCARPTLAGTSKGSQAPAVARDGWPDTPAGAMARRWMEAFSKGDSAMRACLIRDLAPASLEQRGIGERMKNYQASRERFGSLVLASVEKSKPSELEVTLMASDLSKHRFVFTVQSDPPHKLISVGRLEHHMGGHGFGH